MHYRVKDGHGLPHNPFKAIVAPRPIGWISTVDKEGRANLAPYSFFNALGDTPPLVMFSSNGSKIGSGARKDSLANIEETGEFVVNFANWALRDAMNISSGHHDADVDEFVEAGLEKAECLEVSVPRVAAAPAAFECKLHQLVELPYDQPEGRAVMAIGEVLAVHINDEMLRDGRYDLTLVEPLARCGYRDYAVVRELVEISRPDQK